MSKAAPATPRIYPAYCFPAAPTFQKWVKLTAADVQALRQEPGFDGQNIYFHLNHPIEFVYLIGPVVALDHLVTRYGTRFTLFEIDDGSGASIEVKITYKPHASANKNPTPATIPSHNTAADNNGSSSGDDDDDDDDDASSDNANQASSSPKAKPLLTTRIFATTVDHLTVKAGPRGTELLLAGAPIDVGAVLKVKGTLQRWRGAYQLNLRRVFTVRSIDDEVRAWHEYAAFATRVLAKPWVLSDARQRELQDAEREGEERERRRAERRRDRERDLAQRRKVWEAKKARHERHAEKKRLRDARALDGNPLDRPGWRPAVSLGTGGDNASRAPRLETTRASDASCRVGKSDAGISRRRDSVGITTARAVWQHEQQQQLTRGIPTFQVAPARWHHEYVAAKPSAAPKAHSDSAGTANASNPSREPDPPG